MEEVKAVLLDFNKPFDVTLLDQLVQITMNGLHPNRRAANEFLVTMKDHPDMWRRAAAIIEGSKELESRLYGLQVLQEAIATHWKVIQSEEREGIRSYVVSKILEMSTDEIVFKHSNENYSFLKRLNMVLVQILKQDWPHSWSSFVPDMVSSSTVSEARCENNLYVLSLLSEEVFDFSDENLTSEKTRELRAAIVKDYPAVFELIGYVLTNTQRVSLLEMALKTLRTMFTWMPSHGNMHLIFETTVLPVLVENTLRVASLRPMVLECLVEVANIGQSTVAAEAVKRYTTPLQKLLVVFLDVINTLLPATFVESYNDFSELEQLFITRLAVFLGTYLRSFLSVFKMPAGYQGDEYAESGSVLSALMLMVSLSRVDDEEIFKSCVEFWSFYLHHLYTSEANLAAVNATPLEDMLGSNATPFKTALQQQVLHPLRVVMIEKMAKPEEVIVVEDENGDIVREATKDTEVIAQYKTMRDILVHLTHLFWADTEAIMLTKLDEQMSGTFTRNGLNCLCWAIGSISGAMSVVDERRFLVTVIRDLLRMCEIQRGKDNKAIVASNIMYVVGQYPRFLRAHWKFLRTVVSKLFEFMHERHPGVQDMACDTILKIVTTCRRKFLEIQPEENEPYLLTLCHNIDEHTRDLQPHQIQSFYQSLGTILAEPGTATAFHIQCIMKSLNARWTNLLKHVAESIENLFTLNMARELQYIIKINIKVASASGSVYLHQLSLIFEDLMNIYAAYADRLSKACAADGPIAVRYTTNRAYKFVKADILDLLSMSLECFKIGSCMEITKAGPALFFDTFMRRIMELVLNDFKNSIPATRDAKVLNFLATAVHRIGEPMNALFPVMMDAVFERTLEMITQNMQDHPEHRIAFFTFLREANSRCFAGLFSISPAQQKLIIDSIVWAFRHTERNISETGLEILDMFLLNITTSASPQPFFAQFLVPLVEDLFGVLTDRLHKSGFNYHAKILQYLLQLVHTQAVTVPLHTQGPALSNVDFLRDHIGMLLMRAFPNITKAQIMEFLNGLFTPNPAQFKQHLRDFLVTIKEFANEDNAELFREEAEMRRMDPPDYINAPAPDIDADL